MRLAVLITSAVLLIPFLVFSQQPGTISGTVIDEATKEALPFANIQIKGTTTGTASDERGKFTLSNLGAGTYTIIVSLVGHAPKEITGIVVNDQPIPEMKIILRDAGVEMGEVVVFGASMKSERLTEAPAAVSVIEANEIKLNAGAGQVPKLLESKPGVDIAQSGINDFNINTRGFNSSLNRRLLVLLDGRDLAIAFLGAQEWNGLSVPVEDLGRMELVRGPSSALYGANAFNGVINIQTSPPREIVGTKVTVAGGSLNSGRIDVRHAGLKGPLGYKINAGRFQSDTWSVTRKNLNFEYPGFNILNNEEVDLDQRMTSSTYGSGRIDYEPDGDSRLTAEAGITKVENEVFVTGIGRVQVPNALKPWWRASYSNTSWYVQYWGAGRDSRQPQVSLASGLPLAEHSFIHQADAQYRTTMGNNFFLIGGLSLRYQSINTDGTLMREQRKDNASGVYGQLEYTMSEHWKFLAAARWDRSTLHEQQISPKVAVVWSLSADHSIRATFNQAFQAPNLSELFLYILRTATNPYTGIPSYTAYHGNENLRVEKITGFEVGYKGIISKQMFVTADGYFNLLKDFITDLAPGVHPQYPPGTYILPDDPIQTPRQIWSYNNAGKVTEGGFELGINYYLSDSWIVDGNYSYFEFSVLEKSQNDILIPNAPAHKLNGGITYKHQDGFEAGLSVKYVPSFDWSAGIYSGRILAYTLVNVASSYKLNNNFQFGINVSNLLDRVHYEIFGGSLLRFRAVGTVTMTF